MKMNTRRDLLESIRPRISTPLRRVTPPLATSVMHIYLLLIAIVPSAAFVWRGSQPPRRCIEYAQRLSTQLAMSWSDPDWNWGSATGSAHIEAVRLRKELASPEQRKQFLGAVGMMDPDDYADGKIVLALTIQRAAKKCFADDYGLDEEEQCSWRALMDDMADARFEGYRGDLLLAAEIGDRVGLIESKRLSNL